MYDTSNYEWQTRLPVHVPIVTGRRVQVKFDIKVIFSKFNYYN